MTNPASNYLALSAVITALALVIGDKVTRHIINDINPENIKDYLRYLSEEPHIAATERDEKLAEFVKCTWEKHGLDHVSMIPYDVLLSYPSDDKDNKVNIVDSQGTILYSSTSRESTLNNTGSSNFAQGFSAYSPSGIVTADVVYVNYASNEDFDLLEELGINVSGKICISRFGKIFRGNKVENAESRGAVGMILFLDPTEIAPYGTDEANVYPNTWWMPGDAIQRGTIYGSNGDPLTPRYPSLNGVYRYPESEVGLPKIPCQPIGYNDARVILKDLGGQSAPANWTGGLNITYHLGPGFNSENSNKIVRLEVYNSNKRVVTYNVIGTIEGELEPDRYVMVGNHRDAWGFGAIDPSSGTAALLELTRVFGNLHQNGWKPRRTMVFCNWAAEEYGLIGSTEWAEENIHKLSSRGVAYINVDLCIGGDVFEANASPIIADAVRTAAKLVPDLKDNKKTLYNTWKEYANQDKKNTEEPEIATLSSASDQSTIAFVAGVPSIDLFWSIDIRKYPAVYYPALHTAYETFKYIVDFLDPDFMLHKQCSQIWGILLHIFGDSVVIPYNLVNVAQKMMDGIEQLKFIGIPEKLKKQNLSLDLIEEAIRNFSTAAKCWHKHLESLDITKPLAVRQANDKMMMIERIFIKPEGLPNRHDVKHLIFASSLYDDYESGIFPTVPDLLYRIDKLPEEKQKTQWQQLALHLTDIYVAIHQATKYLDDDAHFV